ncbi:MAG TPA: alpha/beta fold hydrolase, partial [Candidatus Binatia bacterium]
SWQSPVLRENSAKFPRVRFPANPESKLRIYFMTHALLPKPFDGVENRSFRWQAGDPAALLIHGFPGTPAEMRPLGTVLRDAGWTVHGLMLPGLGADIATLDQRSFHDWSAAANQAMAELKRQHARVLMVGYSMGGALALHTALDQRPAGLVLLAPFWSFGEGWLKILWPLVHFLIRRVSPLRYADFSAMDVRRALLRMYKNIDLDDPQIQQALRQTALSLGTIAQVRRLGRSAFDRAARIDVPTLVIQGSRDKVARSPCTARLVNRLPNGGSQYRQVDAAHDLVDPESSAWNQVIECLLGFADTIREPSRSATGSLVSNNVIAEKSC